MCTLTYLILRPIAIRHPPSPRQPPTSPIVDETASLVSCSKKWLVKTKSSDSYSIFHGAKALLMQELEVLIQVRGTS